MYEHYMFKEIYEQPTALRQTLSGRVAEQAGAVQLADLDALQDREPAGVQLVACGAPTVRVSRCK
jgi:glucosamine--fructose-6-phosphate aminotransferase (isomerizing)